MGAFRSIVAESDPDPIETAEWVEAARSVIEHEGADRARDLLDAVVDSMRRAGADVPHRGTTAYVNSIGRNKEVEFPGDLALEKRIQAIIAWNALAMVLRANRRSPGIGGHLATYASAATLYEVGFNHFWRGSDTGPGDLVYMQGHSSPGIYARAFVEGRLNETDLDCFRQEAGGKGLSSYPHPWLMPDFWQFATVSMGLSPLLAIYQARFLRYLENRGLVAPSDRKVWAMLGDGEMDEPESLGAISLAAREGLENLIFVINCNLQRLDGPVRGNGKIIQELEGVFRGAGWNVIKVIWGGRWDRLIAQDRSGALLRRMEEARDGDYQNYKAHGGKFTREHFFGTDPELTRLVSGLSDDDIWRLNRGGHDPVKVYNAYRDAVSTKDRPTVILAKTVKGHGLGSAQASNTTHQVKKLALEPLREFRDRYHLPIADADLEDAPFYRPAEDSPEIQYVRERRRSLRGSLPQRRPSSKRIETPKLEVFGRSLEGSGDRTMSTTMAFVRMLSQLVREDALGPRVIPIVPDEARTFGMEGLFRSLKIYSSVGQLYDPVDATQLLAYREARDGQILEEGITEAGAMASWIAAATSYANHDEPMIPFYIYYSMFGFQRVGDLAWAAGDMQARGFLLGGTAGRTTLAGEGLQHQDGHSHVLSSVIPNCRGYDPCFAYELAVVLHEGLRAMFRDQERVYYYITLSNEKYSHPALPDDPGIRDGIVRGMYLLREAAPEKGARVQLLGSGPILREVLAAAERLEQDWGIGADVWSVTSFGELRRDGLASERWNLLNPGEEPRVPYVTECLSARHGPVVAASDYVKLHAEQIRAFLPDRGYMALGTDGFGRSDDRQSLRRFFEVDARFIAFTALNMLAREGQVSFDRVASAAEQYEIDREKADPILT